MRRCHLIAGRPTSKPPRHRRPSAGSPTGILLAGSPDGKWLASAGFVDRTARLWTAEGKPGPVLAAHGDSVHAVAWGPDGKRLASGGYDGTGAAGGGPAARIGRGGSPKSPVSGLGVVIRAPNRARHGQESERGPRATVRNGGRPNR